MRTATESFFKTFDGTTLFSREWAPAPNSNPKKAILLLHRGHEHSGRLQGIVDGLNLPDFHFWAYDARGHGQTPGVRGYAKQFSDLVKDLDVFARAMSEKHQVPMENIVVVANSVGAVVASAWMHDFAPRIRSAVLAAPALNIKLYVPFALPGLRLLNLVKKPAFISSYVKSRMLTHDPDEARRYNEDPLITRDIAVHILIGLYDTARRLIENAALITTPILMLSAGKDYVVSLSTQKKFFDRLGSTFKRQNVFQNFYHGVFYELDKTEPLKMSRDFVLESFKFPVERLELLRSHLAGPTVETYLALSKPASGIKKIFFAMQTATLKTLGRLSQGINLGWASGFDSGLSLDYVYKNKPQGRFLIGKIFDYFYLNSVGWKGIRQRRILLDRSLDLAIENLRNRGVPIRVLDLAGGPGRYLMDMLERHKAKDIAVMVFDNVEANLEEGRKNAALRGLSRIKFSRQDSFNPKINELPFVPNIVVISGFFELFQNNNMLMQAMEHVRTLSAAGAQLIYTGQPYHPQLEMIARVLTNRDQQPWVMRLRGQAEIDEIMRVSGFTKTNQEVDEFGIFTVSLASKNAVELGDSVLSQANEYIL